MTTLTCSLALSPDFRTGDILAFHSRDSEAVAERVSDSSLQKGMIWQGQPACLSIQFSPGGAYAELATEAPAVSPLAFEALVKRMLGLTQDIEAFEQCYCKHPQLGALLARQPGLRVPLAASPFEALSWAITGQQISVSAALSLRRKLIRATDIRHANGLLCYPSPHQILALSDEALRLAGFSQTKRDCLRSLSQQVADQRLPLEAWCDELPVDTASRQLAAIRGIGPWTINYALLRGFGWLDGSLHGDAAVRRGLQTLLASPEAISPQQAADWLAQFSPWRALVAAHLWAIC